MTMPGLQFDFRAKKFMFRDTVDAKDLIKEIFENDTYGVFKNELTFSPGDVIVDVGANEGMFAVMMAKLYPQTRVIAFEPVPRTFETLQVNIKANEVQVETHQLGIGPPGKDEGIMFVSKDHSGGSTSMCTFVESDMIKVPVKLVSLDRAFEACNISRCRLLKMDIEGMEYEVLYPSSVFPVVDYLAMEVHYNRKLDFESRRADGLINWVSTKTNVISATVCQMCE